MIPHSSIHNISISTDIDAGKTTFDAIRQGTLMLEFTPVLRGSAVKNKGVQNLLDAIAL
jgi:translation elongation factor EF-G